MIEAFTAFIEQEKLCLPQDRILVAVSGGPDSVLLAWLFQQSGYAIGLGHCNFRLRGAESDADEAFVRELASSWGIPFHTVSFPTLEISQTEGKSIQEAARDLRYGWLESVRLQEGYDRIATGHHLSDSIETLLFNLVKGCGIRGLHGILPKRDKLIRPLLFTGKKQILEFLHSRGIPFREDRSNRELYYDRNKVRHQIIPVLESLNPGFESSMERTLQRLRDAGQLYEYALEALSTQVVKSTDKGFVIFWEDLQKSPAPATLFYEILAPFGFQAGQFQHLFRVNMLSPGKRWYSKTHCLLSDRKELLLTPLSEKSDGAISIEEKELDISLPDGTLSFRFHDTPPAQWPAGNLEAILDAKKVVFPVRLRRWAPGDVFQPLGMGGRSKKLQDLFTDLKLPRWEKENVWILEISGQIAWVVGHRIDERFKMRESSASCWHFRFEKS